MKRRRTSYASYEAALRAAEKSYGKRKSRSYGKGYTSGYRKGRGATKVVVVAQDPGALKVMDRQVSLTPVLNSTGTNAYYCLNTIKQGTGKYERLNDKVKLKSVRIKLDIGFQFAEDAATPSGIFGNTFRWMLVWDKTPGGTAPLLSAIIAHVQWDGTEASDVLDDLNPDNTSRFSIIRQGHIVANPCSTPLTGSTTDYVRQRYFVDEFVDLKGRETQYQSDTATPTVADISSGGLYFICRAVYNNTYTFFELSANSQCRLRFYG